MQTTDERGEESQDDSDDEGRREREKREKTASSAEKKHRLHPIESQAVLSLDVPCPGKTSHVCTSYFASSFVCLSLFIPSSRGYYHWIEKKQGEGQGK